MVNIRELRATRHDRVEKARAIVDKAKDEERDLTDDEEAEFKSLEAEIEKRSKEIDREERLQALEAEKDNYEPAPENDGEFKSLGEFLYSVRFNQNDPRLMESRAAGDPQTFGTGASGGYLVPPKYMTEVLTVGLQEAIIRPRATVIPADAGNPDATLYMPAIDYSADLFGGVSVAIVSEGGAKPETAMDFKQVTLAPKEIAGHIVVNDKLLQNYAQSEALFGGMLRSAIIAAEDNYFLNGTAGGPTGIIGHASVAEVPRDTANQISYVDIASMYASAKFGGSLVWIGSPTILPQLMNMEDTGGSLIWQPNARDNSPGNLLGLPMLLNGRSPVLGTEGDLVLADLKYYLIKDGFGLAVGASEHVYYLTNQTVIKAFKRVDGAPWLTAPLTLEDGTTEVSPFVVLTDEAS